MSAIEFLEGDVIAHSDNHQIHWWCPGCVRLHTVTVMSDTSPYGWSWNGDCIKPTLSPSVLTTWEEGDNYEKKSCHCYVSNGSIDFLSDSSHHLAGKSIPLTRPPLDR
jgi:hypothetical protein